LAGPLHLRMRVIKPHPKGHGMPRGQRASNVRFGSRRVKKRPARTREGGFAQDGGVGPCDSGSCAPTPIKELSHRPGAHAGARWPTRPVFAWRARRAPGHATASPPRLAGWGVGGHGSAASLGGGGSLAPRLCFVWGDGTAAGAGFPHPPRVARPRRAPALAAPRHEAAGRWAPLPGPHAVRREHRRGCNAERRHPPPSAGPLGSAGRPPSRRAAGWGRPRCVRGS